MSCNAAITNILEAKTIKLTMSQIKVIFGAQKIENLLSPDRGYLVWLKGFSAPPLPIEIPRQFYLDRNNRPLSPVRWIHDQHMIDRFRIPFRGYVDFVYGNFFSKSPHGKYFQMVSPLKAKHLLIRVRWNIQAQLSQQYAFTPLDCRTQYYEVKGPNAQGIGYDFLVIPVEHQEKYDYHLPGQHQSFIASCRTRHDHDEQTRVAVEQRLAAEQLAALSEYPSDPAECRARLEKLQSRIWRLYGDGYKKLSDFKRLTFDDDRGSAEFMGRNYPYTRKGVYDLEGSVGRYEEDARRRDGVLRKFYALRTQFEQHGQKLELDVPTATPGHPTLAVRLNGCYYTYSSDTIGKLTELLKTFP